VLGGALVVAASASAEPDGPAAALPGGFTPNYRAIVEQAAGAVVGVEVVGLRTPLPEEWPPAGTAPSLLFGGKLPFHGLGSGFIISGDGLVLTSAHVIQGARRVTVRLRDRRQLRARVLGSDPLTDVAVLHTGSPGPAGAAHGADGPAAGG
jgi:serine protease Do